MPPLPLRLAREAVGSDPTEPLCLCHHVGGLPEGADLWWRDAQSRLGYRVKTLAQSPTNLVQALLERLRCAGRRRIPFWAAQEAADVGQ